MTLETHSDLLCQCYAHLNCTPCLPESLLNFSFYHRIENGTSVFYQFSRCLDLHQIKMLLSSIAMICEYFFSC